jgi:hypothetical protein
MIKEEAVNSGGKDLSETWSLKKKANDAFDGGVIKIKTLDCLNDFVAVLRFQETSTIELPENQRLKNEGIVIGVGPGLIDGTKARLILGDVVAFLPRNIVTEIKATQYPYENQTITILSERNIIMKLDPMPHEFIHPES